MKSKFSNNHPKELIYQFLDFHFDPSILELSTSNKTIPLKLQPAKLLELLLIKAPSMVTREEIQQELWNNGETVEFEHGLNTCMNQLRKVLKENSSDLNFIQTLPKRGYQFIPTVNSSPRKKMLLSGKNLFAILVLLIVMVTTAIFKFTMFESTEKPIRLYISPIEIDESSLLEYAGIIEYALRLDVIENLQNKNEKQLQVITGESLWSAFDSTRKELDIQYNLLMKLSSKRTGGYIINAKMTSQGNGVLTKNKNFVLNKLDLKNLQKVSTQLAIWSANSLGLKISESEKQLIFSEDPPDYIDAMLRAKRAFLISDGKSLRQSLDWYQKAIEIKPGSPEARGGKAMALTLLAGSSEFPATATYQKAMMLVYEIETDNDATIETELVRGYILLYQHWDLVNSRKAFDAALQIKPNNAIVHAWRAAVLAAQGDTAGAAKESDLAVRLDPLSMSISADRCWYLTAANKLLDAVKACQWALDIKPKHSASQLGLAFLLEQLGEPQQALDILSPILERIADNQKDQAIINANEQLAADLSTSKLSSAYCQLANHLSNRAGKGQFPLVKLASFYSQCGEFEKIPDLLAEAFEGGESGVLFYQIDPYLKRFRGSPLSNNTELNIKKRN